jgi:nicotinamide phosphoribosyltransferase
MGGALLQKVDRDTQKFALKCSSAVINGKEFNVAKSPTEMDAGGILQ